MTSCRTGIPEETTVPKAVKEGRDLSFQPVPHLRPGVCRELHGQAPPGPQQPAPHLRFWNYLTFINSSVLLNYLSKANAFLLGRCKLLMPWKALFGSLSEAELFQSSANRYFLKRIISQMISIFLFTFKKTPASSTSDARAARCGGRAMLEGEGKEVWRL